MKRILRALSAFALSLTFILALAVTPASAAENTLHDDSESSYAGYLLILNEPQAVLFSDDPFAAATLMAAEAEQEELITISENWSIYKAGTLEQIQNLVYSGRVAVVEPDYQAELFDFVPVEPNDPRLKTKQTNLIGDYGVTVQSAWEAGLTGAGVTVAVIDSGLNINHEDCPEKVGHGRYYYYRESENGSTPINGKKYGYYSSGDYNDSMGHGSMVCGLIAAATNNNVGISSIAPGVTILPIRCFTSTPGHVAGLTSNLISGIDFAVESGADIINMSWGVKEYSAALQNSIDKASEAGCILIAAAGNEGSVTNQYPAAWTNVISVGATNSKGELCYYSQRLQSVDICAPGGDASAPIYSLGSEAPDEYRQMIGTSFAAPTVAATAALLLQVNPTMTQHDFLALLLATSYPVEVDDAGNTSAPKYAGWGRINIQALLDAVGYAGCSAIQTDDGFKVYTSFHPNFSTGKNGVITMVAGYNEAGHLIESQSAIPSKSVYNNCAAAFTFQNPNIARFQTFYLDPGKAFSSLVAPITPLLE